MGIVGWPRIVPKVHQAPSRFMHQNQWPSWSNFTACSAFREDKNIFQVKDKPGNFWKIGNCQNQGKFNLINLGWKNGQKSQKIQFPKFKWYFWNVALLEIHQNEALMQVFMGHYLKKLTYRIRNTGKSKVFNRTHTSVNWQSCEGNVFNRTHTSANWQFCEGNVVNRTLQQIDSLGHETLTVSFTIFRENNILSIFRCKNLHSP